MKPVITRFAPSPTGTLHIGGLRTALFNYVYSKQNNGKFLIRIEDTDRERSTKEFEKNILDNLSSIGLTPDENPINQSERNEIYVKAAEKIIESGKAYWCDCSPEDLEQMRKEQTEAGKKPMYDGRSRNLGLPKTDKTVLRLATPENRLSSRKGPAKLLVLGGSRGSQAINELVPAAVSTIGIDQRPSILHQTGKSNLKMTRAIYSALDIEAEVTEFIDAIEDAYEWADFVICRSGALTVAELTSVGLGSILIPFPYAIDDHQTANARLLEANGAAVIYQQSELTFELLGKLIIKFAIDPCNRLDMAMAARKLAKNNAADQVAKTCLEYFNAKA